VFDGVLFPPIPHFKTFEKKVVEEEFLKFGSYKFSITKQLDRKLHQ
jgi:hypothetical protein